MLRQVIKFLFAIFSYLLGLSSLMGFFWYIQFGIDRDPHSFSWAAVLQNTLVFLVFPLQHSILPRERIKNWIQEHFDPLLERCLYVAASGAAMWIILRLWIPIGPYVYRIGPPIFFDLVFYVALALIIVSTIGLEHASMFGLKQGYFAWKKIPLPDSGLKTTGIYGVVRHPLTSLLIVTLWAHATMTVGRLQWNILFTAYALIGTVFEEKSLIRNLKDEYLEYRRRVPAFVPRIGPRIHTETTDFR